MVAGFVVLWVPDPVGVAGYGDPGGSVRGRSGEGCP
jgi:hypothetical protein